MWMGSIALWLTAVVGAVIWLTGLFIDPYLRVETLAFHKGYPAHVTNWTLLGKPDSLKFDSAVTLSGGDDVQRAFYKVEVPIEKKKAGVRVWVDMHMDNVGKDPSATSHVGLWFINNTGRFFSYQNMYVFPGRYSSTHAMKLIDWPQDAIAMAIGMIIKPGGPTITVRGMQVEAVEPNARYRVMVAAVSMLTGCWLILLMVYAIRCLTRKQLLTLGLILCALVAGTQITGDFLQYANSVMRKLFLWFDLQPGVQTFWVFKVGHVVAFLLLTAFLCSVHAQLRFHLWEVVVFAILLAIATEGVQLHLPDRSAGVEDIALNLLGISISASLYWFFFSRLRDT